MEIDNCEAGIKAGLKLDPSWAKGRCNKGNRLVAAMATSAETDQNLCGQNLIWDNTQFHRFSCQALPIEDL